MEQGLQHGRDIVNCNFIVGCMRTGNAVKYCGVSFCQKIWRFDFRENKKFSRVRRNIVLHSDWNYDKIYAMRILNAYVMERRERLWIQERY